MFKLNTDDDTRKPNTETTYSLQKKNINTEDVDSSELKNFIEISLSDIDKLQKGDFIRYRLKSDGILKKGGYLFNIFSKTLKNGTEKTYIQLSFNKTFLENNSMGIYKVSLDNIDKIYKKIDNNIEYNIIKNSIDGISDNFNSDINNLYDATKNKEDEILLLKQEIELLKKENKKTEERFKKIVSYVKEISERIR